MEFNGNGTKAAVATLNGLIEICRDGEEGYRAAADGLMNESLRQLFTEYSEQRARLASELQEQVRHLGGAPEDSGTAAGALHRGWINIKSAVTGEDEAAVLAECERGEDAALKTYEEAMEQEGLPPETRSLIEKQYTQVKVAHDRIREMEQAQH